jgi:hypothetical protein
MADSISSQNAYAHYAQKENPVLEITKNVTVHSQPNEAIIEFVANQMDGTLGAGCVIECH